MSTDDTKETGAPVERDEIVGRAAVVLKIDDIESSYTMFDITQITSKGAFLASSLFLERGEQVTLELSLSNNVEIRTDARVVGLDAGRTPGINVEFSNLDASDAALLEERTASGQSA